MAKVYTASIAYDTAFVVLDLERFAGPGPVGARPSPPWLIAPEVTPRHPESLQYGSQLSCAS